MRRIDFYKKKEKLNKQMINAICNIMDANLVEEINFKDLGVDGGYACILVGETACEYQIDKLKHDIGTDYLGVEVTDEWGNEVHANLNDDALNASFDTVYDAVYYLLYDKEFADERKRLMEHQKPNGYDTK